MTDLQKPNSCVDVFFYPGRNEDENRKARTKLEGIQKSNHFNLVVLNSEKRTVLTEDLLSLQVGPYKLNGKFQKKEFLVVLKAAENRLEHLQQIDAQDKKIRKSAKNQFNFWDRLSLWMTRQYVTVICVFFFLYVSVPFVAPIFMKLGQEKPAKVIYSIYYPLCHQLAFRSYFLFGTQPFYPRVLAGINLPITWDSITGTSSIDFFTAKNFIGDSFLGYKVAICERDVALYGSFAIFAMIFGLTHRRIKSISFWLWLALGVLPIAIDGTSQFSGIGLDILKWLPPRESTPLLRTITGILFGFLSGWYVLPMLEQTIISSRQELIKRFELIKQSSIK